MFPIIYCINNTDITDDDNWAPCILNKVRKDQYEVMDVNGNLKVDKDMEWEGDDGLSTTWTMYHKYPSTSLLILFVQGLRWPLKMIKRMMKKTKNRKVGKWESGLFKWRRVLGVIRLVEYNRFLIRLFEYNKFLGLLLKSRS
jgi:hypothetical protein